MKSEKHFSLLGSVVRNGLGIAVFDGVNWLSVYERDT